MKKTIFTLLVLIIIAGGYYFYDKTKNQVKAPVIEQNNQQNDSSNVATPTPTPSQAVPNTQTNVKGNTGPDYSPGTFSSGDENTDGGTNVQVLEVDYDGNGFSPSSIDINVNDWVFFKNTSTTDVWVASNPHPTHTDYPGFDAKKKIAPGATFKFQFTKAGAWGYHNHLNPSQGGVVNVK